MTLNVYPVSTSEERQASDQYAMLFCKSLVSKDVVLSDQSYRLAGRMFTFHAAVLSQSLAPHIIPWATLISPKTEKKLSCDIKTQLYRGQTDTTV